MADVMCTLVQLARGGDSDAERLVDQYDWYIMPVVNPDGYSFTFTDVSIAHALMITIISVVHCPVVLKFSRLVQYSFTDCYSSLQSLCHSTVRTTARIRIQ